MQLDLFAPLVEFLVDFTNELILEGMNHEAGHLVAIADALGDHGLVIGALPSQEFPLVQAEHIVESACFFFLLAFLFVHVGSSRAHSNAFHAFHGDDPLVSLTLVHIVLQKVDVHVGLLSSISTHSQSLDHVVLFLDGLLDVDSLLDALLHHVLELVSHRLLVVHVLFHQPALFTQLGLLRKDGANGQLCTLDREEMNVDELRLPAVPVNFLFELLSCQKALIEGFGWLEHNARLVLELPQVVIEAHLCVCVTADFDIGFDLRVELKVKL